MITKKINIIGAGLATMKFLEYFLELETKDNLKKIKIYIFSNEEHSIIYNRIMLSSLLAKEKTLNDITIMDEEFFITNNITLYSNTNITRIDKINKYIYSDDKKYSYNKLIIATGSNSVEIPAYKEIPRVLVFRDLEDIDKIQNQIKKAKHKKALVIGGGLLGLEASYGLSKENISTTIVELGNYIMDKQLDLKASNLLSKKMNSLGVDILCSTTITSIKENEDKTLNITLNKEDKTINLDVDFVITAIGVRPNKKVAKNLETNRAIIVNKYMQTTSKNIYAIGECCEFKENTYGIVAPIYKQAFILANNLSKKKKLEYKEEYFATYLKITGIDLFSCGDFNANTEGSESIIYENIDDDIYKKIVIKDDRIIGVVSYGETRLNSWHLELFQNKTNIRDRRGKLMFDDGFVDS